MPAPFAYAGTLSHGTMRPQDTLPIFYTTLRELDRSAADKIGDEMVKMLTQCREHGDEDVAELSDMLFYALDRAAPEGYTFGAHEGDGSDYGFWEVETNID